MDRRGSLTWKEFSKIHIPVPSLDEQLAIVEVFECCDRELMLLDRQLDAFKEQKKGLMQQLLTGKVRVKLVAWRGYMTQVIFFDEAIQQSADCKKRHLLLGNGFSIACKPDIFTYKSLKSRPTTRAFRRLPGFYAPWRLMTLRSL